MDLIKLIKSISFSSVGNAVKTRSKAKRADLGILKVALMVAALDGKVLDLEYEAFSLLACKSLGYTDKQAEAAMDQALRAAGYIMLQASRMSDEELVKIFIREAELALPSGFANMAIEDIRRAIITWIAMAISDGDYSHRERICIEAVRQHFAELKAGRMELNNKYWQSVPANVRCIVEDYPGSRLKLASKDFVGKVETIVQQFGGTADAKRKLSSLIAKGE